MTINGGSLWATASHSYGNSSVQGQSGASGTASTDFTEMMSQAANTLLATLDTNQNGTIDKAEFSDAAKALAEKTGKTYNNAENAFSTIDANSDGSISADELLNALQQAQKKNTTGQTSSAQQSATSTLSDETTAESKMQSVLLQRIMEAYTGGSAQSSSTTLATA
ncbi:EF-hand domain-containing protein [uncultured Sulfuricurvum sp.]|uniref:EF-hand domain-containing protein n=2 Tax=Sulfuricurvum TaxID=286130 RepID=UPI0026291D21|nr:EF-hand domain-containing protein [uncultured Sulfuricurvum sp.]